jgi:hypothetical protein
MIANRLITHGEFLQYVLKYSLLSFKEGNQGYKFNVYNKMKAPKV